MPDPIALDELHSLFAAFAARSHVVLAVSGGADSTAMMLLATRWQEAHPGTRLTVVTIDHALRPESAAECTAVTGQAERLGLPCLVRHWSGPKPSSRLQESARTARYALLAEAAVEIGADAIATAHTLDDQAETVLMRLLHGSSVDGLAAMRPESMRNGLTHLRPLLAIPKARLVATLEAEGIAWTEDPSNRNSHFERVRLRHLLAEFAPLGLDSRRLALLAERAARSADALEAIAAADFARAFRQDGTEGVLDGSVYRAAPAEIRLRLLERAIDRIRPGEAGKPYGLRLERLETLAQAIGVALPAGGARQWSLGGVLVRLARGGDIHLAAEPPRLRGQVKNKV
ncbi:tRNA lysidine(34) synthetase TilS [Labrys okinawensis]|uniref:tRNA lysidine(34) synthetase TilS n=1 Tax=Labrys okinawensis TaxID=346911 RepID=UPI0039BD1963